MTDYSSKHYSEVAKRAAEGTDAQAASVGLTHSSKVWAQQAGTSATAAAASAQEAEDTLANKIDKGYAVEDFASNCIAEIPQDIKLTLSNGTLTLKSGSKYYMANGSVYQTNADRTTTQTSDGQYVIVIVESGASISTVALSKCASGSTDSLAGVPYHLWYDSTNNVVNYYSSDGTTPNTRALPLAIVTASNGAISSIDNVFNGAGYIGHHIFVLPGVKALTPTGLNSDGTLNSATGTTAALGIYEVRYTTLKHITITNAGVSQLRGFYQEVDELNTIVGSQYLQPKNEYYFYTGSVYTQRYETPLAFFNYDGTSITDFDIVPVSGLSSRYINTALGYTPENSANKVTSVSSSSTDTQYPTAKALYSIAATKQDTIDDLETIRSGAAAGSTAVQPSALGSAAYTNSTDYATAAQGAKADTAIQQAGLDTALSTKIDKGYAANDFATNCITEIPQDIILTLSGGTLTLKAGSKVYVPSGVGVSNEYEITSDMTYTNTSNGTYILFLGRFNIPWTGAPGFAVSYPLQTVSGSTDSLAGTTYHTWYDTTNNLIKRYTSDASTPSGYFSYPLAIITVSDGAISSIDKIFNGAGYIGHHAFVLPGVKGLCPNGVNTDGSYKPISFNIEALNIIELTTNYNWIGINNDRTSVAGWGKYTEIKTKDGYNIIAGERVYVQSENYLYIGSFSSSQIRSIAPIVSCEYNGTAVTRFEIRPVAGLSKNYISDALTSVSGYNGSATQTLKHVNGVLTWVTDA